MDFANDASSDTVFGQESRARLDVIKSHEMMFSTVEAILSVLVSVQPSVDGGATSAARSSAGEGIVKPDTLGGKLVDVGSLGVGISVAP